MKKIKNISIVILIIGYALAGINHFNNPISYIKIIPHYIPYPVIVNYLAGSFELLFALMLIFDRTRILAAWGIIFMLIAFLPVHIQMIADAPLLLGGSVIVSPLIAWLRLLLQPVLILWVWWHTKTDNV